MSHPTRTTRVAALALMGVCVGLPSVALATARTTIVVQATVDDSLQAVHGTLTVRGEDIHLVDVLPQLPVPDENMLARRTFPRAPGAGIAHHNPAVGGTTSFTTILPERYGASGMVRGRGLFANGLWHPQPVEGGAPAVVHWVVELKLPEDTVGVLNGAVAKDTLRWSGEADRLSLAVVPGARVTDLNLDVGQVLLVERGPKRPKRAERLREAVLGAWQGPGAPKLVVVDTPSRRRLTRTGPQTLYLSDRAFRVSGGLWRFHLPAVQQGILEAGLPVTDPWERELAAAALAQEVDPGLDIQQMLGWWSWIPEIDALLYDGRLPFYSDVFTEVWPGDPIADDLAEVLEPTTPGQAICARLDARQGDGTCVRLAWDLIQSNNLDTAADESGVDIRLLREWRPEPAPQALSLTVDDSTGIATLDRRAAPVAESGRAASSDHLVAEPIPFSIDQETRTWQAPAGDGQLRVPLPEGVDRVAIDPHHTLLQDTRSDDRWPTRWVPVAAFFPTELSITNRRISAYASLALREQYSTRWVFVGDIGTDPVNLVESSLGAVYAFGPLQDRRSRPYRVWFGGGPALLDPDFRPVEGNGLALGSYAGFTWDTIPDGIFPTSGHTLRAWGSGGFVPGGTAWWGAGTSAGGVQGIGGRFAFAGRLSADMAAGDILHRLISLGGGSALQGITPQAVVGEERLLAKTELRWQAIRFASVPGPLVWLSHVQLNAGLEAGTLTADGKSCPTADGCRWTATGWTGGIVFTGDVLGVRPTHLGATFAGPLTWSDDTLAPSGFPQLYVRLTQAF